MTTNEEAGAAAARPSRARHWAGIALALVAGLALFAGIVASWADRTLFDSREFADRSVVVLQSAAARHALAEELADRIDAADPALVAFRSGLVDLVDDVVATPAFQAIFRAAIEQVHRVVVSRHADRAVLDLGEMLGLLTSSGEVSNQDLVAKLPKVGTALLVDAAPVLRRIQPGRIGERVRWVSWAAWVVAGVAAVGALALSADRRRTLHRLGLGVAGAGLGVVLVARLAPRAAGDRIDDPDLAQAVVAAATGFVGDLAVLGLWVVGIGAVVAAAAGALGPPHPVSRLRRLGPDLERWAEASRPSQTLLGLAMAVLGGLVVAFHETLLPVVLVALGAYLAYAGLVLAFTGLLGPVRALSLAAEAADVSRRHAAEHAVVAASSVVVLALLAVGLFTTVAGARADARHAAVMRCNGSADLCDRRLDQVVFAGSHNSMSSATEPGWFFPENLTGVPAQLESGVRALLVKTHYGIPTGVEVGGHELVVTDTASEVRAGQAEEAAELSAEAVAKAQELEATVHPGDQPVGVYLCHVYCSLGAVKFEETLGQIRRFLDRNPHEVVMLFIGDFVTPQDTQKVLEQAGLLDRVWNYDTGQPPPTLRQMIEAKRNLLVLGENHGGALPWYTKGYGIFQDTPFTFTDPSQFSCAANRGPTDAPLFELNHFITTKQPPSVDEARVVNAYDVLMGRAKQCQAERKLLPNIVAVNFSSVGDLVQVVRDLNG